jgi:hypothetical protein
VGPADVIESGPSRPPRRMAVGSVLVLVVVAGLAGYFLGHRHNSATPAAPPSSSAAAAEVAMPLAPTSKRCSIQLKDQLQLGLEVVNQSSAPLTLRKVSAVLPLNGLRATVTSWGACGQLSPAPGGDNYPLPAGGTAWLSITFDVLVACPAPLPVEFTVQYTSDGQSGTALLTGFPDLGDVPYASARCTTGPS